MEPTTSGIQFIDSNPLGEAISGALGTLTRVKLREEEARKAQEAKLEDALTIATSGMAGRDATEINAAMQKFMDNTKKVARDNNGNIPYDKWAEIKSEKANIEAMVKRSENDQKTFAEITKYVNTTGRNYLDVEETQKALNEEMRKPVSERTDLWNTVIPQLDLIEYTKKHVKKATSGGYEIKGNKIITTKTNDAPLQILNMMKTDDKYRRGITKKWEENPNGYATPEDYAVGMYSPFVSEETKTVKQVSSGRGPGGKKSTKQYTVDANGNYNFSTSPIILHDIEDVAGRSLGAFSISKIRQEGDKVIGVGTSATNFYYGIDDLARASRAVANGNTNTEFIRMKQLYDDLPGTTQIDKKAALESRMKYESEVYENPNKKAGETMEIELSPSDAALVKEKLSQWTKIETAAAPKKAAATKGNGDPAGLGF